jgi:NADPH-dependent 2,4-dienoyl-CoA reductase/sulfur reductase-like enzyme
LAVTGIDPQARAVTTSEGTRISYDRLVLAPGIDLRWDALPGYGAAAAERMPHAWKAGAQTDLLRRQLAAMEDGGLVVIAARQTPIAAHQALTRRQPDRPIFEDEKTVLQGDRPRR